MLAKQRIKGQKIKDLKDMYNSKELNKNQTFNISIPYSLCYIALRSKNSHKIQSQKVPMKIAP